MFSNQGNQAGGKKKRTRSRPNRTRNKVALEETLINTARYQFVNVKKINQNHAKSIFQAPHQDEPVDLTDDLAPDANVTQTMPGTTGENKLNFKLQKTVQKTPDWTKYQNNFKTISGASPDKDLEEIQLQDSQKPKNRWDQPTVDLTNGYDEDVEMMDASEKMLDLKVAVTTEPYQYLFMEQVKQIEEALANKIQDAILNNCVQPYVPAFLQKPVYNLGYLPLTCEGAQDLLWLHEILAEVPSPIPNTRLTVKPQSDFLQIVKVGIFIPNFSGSLEELQIFLQKQNHWYNMSSWSLINSQRQGEDTASYYLLYSVPEDQAKIIDNRDRRMAYNLGTVLINVYNKERNAKHTGKEFNFRNIAKHLIVCVVPEPFHYLTLQEANMVKWALSCNLKDGISQSNEYIPTFRGSPCHYKGGLRLWCESDRDLKWLKDSVSSIVSPIIGTKLVVKEQFEIPERARVKIFLPNAPKDVNIVVELLKRQNAWCNMESWVLFSLEESPGKLGVGLVLYIPSEQVNILKEKGFRLSYLLGYVKVSLNSSKQ